MVRVKKEIIFILSIECTLKKTSEIFLSRLNILYYFEYSNLISEFSIQGTILNKAVLPFLIITIF